MTTAQRARRLRFSQSTIVKLRNYNEPKYLPATDGVIEQYAFRFKQGPQVDDTHDSRIKRQMLVDPRIRRVRWFATRSDLEPGLKRFEAIERLNYILAGYYDSLEILALESALAIEHLGECPVEFHPVAPRYLVVPRGSEIHVDTIYLTAGGCRYAVRTDNNLSGFLVGFGGVFQNRKLIGGGCMRSPKADPGVDEMLLKYAASVTEGFTQVRDPRRGVWQVGPEALEMLKRGMPLATSDPIETHLLPNAIPKRKQ